MKTSTDCRDELDNQRTIPHHPSNRPISSVVKRVAIGAVGLGFDSWPAQIGHSAANSSQPLRRLSGAVLPRR